MNRPAQSNHGLKPFQMYSVGAVQRETQNFFEFQGQTLVNYKSRAGQAIGDLAYVEGKIPVHTCHATDFAAWAGAPLPQATAA